MSLALDELAVKGGGTDGLITEASTTEGWSIESDRGDISSNSLIILPTEPPGVLGVVADDIAAPLSRKGLPLTAPTVTSAGTNPLEDSVEDVSQGDGVKEELRLRL